MSSPRKTNFAHDDFICVSIDFSGIVLKICFIYNPPTGSLYLWEIDDLFVLMKNLNLNETTIGAKGTIIAGELNLSSCDWANQSLTNTYEQFLQDKLSENCFVIFLHSLDSKLDVNLTNHPELFLKSYVDRRLTKAYQIIDKNCLDHSAFGANLETYKQPPKDLSGMLLAFNNVYWVKFNEDILSTLFHRTFTAM